MRVSKHAVSRLKQRGLIPKNTSREKAIKIIKNSLRYRFLAKVQSHNSFACRLYTQDFILIVENGVCVTGLPPEIPPKIGRSVNYGM